MKAFEHKIITFEVEYVLLQYKCHVVHFCLCLITPVSHDTHFGKFCLRIITPLINTDTTLLGILCEIYTNIQVKCKVIRETPLVLNVHEMAPEFRRGRIVRVACPVI
jgi:hypothetical protein